MPRRIPDYPDGYLVWNQLASLGSYITFYGVIFFFVAIWFSFFKPIKNNLIIKLS